MLFYLFILLTIAMALLLAALLRKGNTLAGNSQRSSIKIAAVIDIWLLYVAATSAAGFFLVGGIPPRIPLALVLPAITAAIIFVARKSNSELIAAIPHRAIIALQSFRIVVELMLWQGAIMGTVPTEATFEGYNFDVIIGLAALPVALLAFRGPSTNRILLKVFNYTGLLTLAIVAFIFISRAYAPGLWHQSDDIIALGFGMFPYTFLPAFLMPVAVFLHLLSLTKLKRERIN
jgi:hypothetical protein